MDKQQLQQMDWELRTAVWVYACRYAPWTCQTGAAGPGMGVKTGTSVLLLEL